MRKPTNNNSIKVTGIEKYVINKNLRKYTRYRITPESAGEYFHNGSWISEEAFNKLFPCVLVPVNYKGANCDGTAI